MTGSAALRLASDGFASFGPRGELRKKVGEAGRIHLDRWLPFIVLHRSSDPENGIARRMAMNSPSYLIWSPDEDAEARAALDAVLPAIREKLGPVIVFELADEDWKPHAEDSPRLPDFDVCVGHSGSKGARVAFNTLSKAIEKIKVELRHPDVKAAHLKHSLFGELDHTDRIHLCIPQIHRAPDGTLYPQLTHDLAIALTDAILRSAAAYMAAAGSSPPLHHRSLGRSAFLKAALEADRKLDNIANSFDFLLSLSPINSQDAMARFFAQCEEKPPKFRYRPLTVDPDIAKRELYEIDLSRLEDPLLERLLSEKRREIDYQLTLLATRNTPGFRPASMLLYGTVSRQLLSDAHAVLGAVKPGMTRGKKIGAHDVAAAANDLVSRYRSIDERFQAKVEVRDDVSGLLVSGDRLLISSATSMAESRLDALLSHEVSVHLLTYFNGSTQGLSIFRTGLAQYEGIQEGLGVFAEWAVGGLTSSRLRLLAGRVVAVEAMIEGAEFIDVYRRLTNDLGFSKRVAFDLCARVFRSGGFAKDAIYLKGFRAVMDRVATGASLDAFWLGKIAPEHVDAIEELLLRGLLHAPVFVPDFLERDDSKSRIARLREGLAFDRLLDPE
ncbi:DUF1704 domain-containing protein [Sphingomonas sediminicola]|uniref:flavohemoglobin expression-modulating QEGLA motif protein n=1 Tax=Sphingomonas sediminicola TaxID=386874 RepID=UPI003CED12AB